jgi:hypothetical protein
LPNTLSREERQVEAEAERGTAAEKEGLWAAAQVVVGKMMPAKVKAVVGKMVPATATVVGKMVPATGAVTVVGKMVAATAAETGTARHWSYQPVGICDRLHRRRSSS